jgi:hypothetical protein
VSIFSKTGQNDASAQDTPDVQRKPLGAMLVEAGLIDDGQLAEALHEGTETGERLGELVVRHGWVSEEDVARLLAEQWDLAYVDRASIWFDSSSLERLSREDAQKLEAMPIRVEGDHVMVAVAEPTEQRLMDLQRLLGDDTIVVVVPKSALDAGIRSELLTSRGSAADEFDANEASNDDEAWMKEPMMSEEPIMEEWVDTPEEHGQPESAAPLRAVPSPAGGKDMSALAAHAREIADFISGHAAVVRDYERRINELETELAANEAATSEAKTQLAAVLQLVDVLKPAV